MSLGQETIHHNMNAWCLLQLCRS